MNPAYPLYLKYSNGSSFFEVLSADHFREIKIEQDNYSVYEVHANTLPDRNLMADMLAPGSDTWIQITREEFDEKEQHCLAHKKLI